MRDTAAWRRGSGSRYSSQAGREGLDMSTPTVDSRVLTFTTFVWFHVKLDAHINMNNEHLGMWICPEVPHVFAPEG